MNKFQIDERIYTKKIVYAALYTLLHKGYFLMGKEENKILITIFPKKNTTMEELKKDIQTELTTTFVHSYKAKKNRLLSEMIVRRVLKTQGFSI